MRLALKSELANFKAAHDKEIESAKTELSNQKQRLEAQRAEQLAIEDDLQFREHQCKSRQKKLDERSVQLDEDVEEKLFERKLSYDAETQQLKNECERLRSSVQLAIHERETYAELKQQLGGDAPEKILAELTAYREEIKTLKAALLNPQSEIQQSFETARLEKEKLEHQLSAMTQKHADLQGKLNLYQQTEFELAQAKSEFESLSTRYEAVSADNNQLRAELKRLSPAFERAQEREKRIEDIRRPLFDFKKVAPLMLNRPAFMSEIEWLDNIHAKSAEYGLTFSKRILFAFHTALKTAEWSPITVLAGVSGTGKSELPRLYSHFGGINFLNLPVQPNWDSQESMLGFFNSIDNCFDAQPVLNLLAQSQEAYSDDYPGLADTVNLVLLDEMNLAHVELYFAEFLSKLEQRRGAPKSKVPHLDVKLGAGVPPLNISLGRNVLWAGTMNQDETTKSLSDKVLDRGIAIHFPRPKELHSRKRLTPLSNPSSLLPLGNWQSWISFSSEKLPAEEIKKYKNIVENINTFLSVAGRALGHRVWQSVEYYLINYPAIKALEIDTGYSDHDAVAKWLKVAFEDQLVQKIMPKLRGIETRGQSKTACLDKIRQLLVDHKFSIVDDFNRACQAGYGQFIWSSAEYLNHDEMFEQESISSLASKTVSEENGKGTVVSVTAEPDQNDQKLESTENFLDTRQRQQLMSYAILQQKEIWQLTTKEIMSELNVEPRRANQVKKLLNQEKKG